MPNYDLHDQVAIVTGGGSGIGRAVAQRLAREGCKVTVADINETAARTVATEIVAAGGVALPLVVDVTQKAAVDQMVQETVRQLGPLTIQVNNAGIVRIATLLELSLIHI